jgi:hypothetical protein
VEQPRQADVLRIAPPFEQVPGADEMLFERSPEVLDVPDRQAVQESPGRKSEAVVVP